MSLSHRLTGLAGRFVGGTTALLLAATAVTAVTTTVTATPAGALEPTVHRSPSVSISACPALYALGVQGTGESAPDAAPSTDTGMLSAVFQPMLAKAGEQHLVDRAYVPYEASFGGVLGTGPQPYSQSIENGLDNLRAMVREISGRCADTRFALAGYSQGAHVVSMFAQQVGQDQGVIPADRIAAVALFGDPTRNPGAPLFPGAPGKLAPDPAPGTSGTALTGLEALQVPAAAGGGIGPSRDVAQNFGSLTGRVATFCVGGDLACDAPSGAPILRVVSNVVGQFDLSGGDPLRALGSIAQALAYTAIKTATTVVNRDVQGDSLATLSIEPEKSLSQRLADASDPRNPLNLPAAMHAVMKVGLIGLNSVLTVVRTVLAPDNISDLATVGLSDPMEALLLLGQKLIGAIPQLIPPTTGVQLVEQSFKAVTEDITDNRELLNTATWVRYWDTVQRHGAYTSTGVTADGQAPVRFVADWFAALARDLAQDLAGRSHNSETSPRSDPISVPQATTSAGLGAAVGPQSNGAGQFPFETNQSHER